MMGRTYSDQWREQQHRQIESRVYSFAHHFIEQFGGGLLAGNFDCAGAKRVLDVACGSGEWTCSFARAHPNSEVLGIDQDAEMVAAARSQAMVVGLKNAHFSVGSMYTVPLAEEMYDLIHARLLLPVVSPGTWYEMFKKLRKHCRTGGHIVWTEARMPFTTSTACARWCHLFGQALGITSSNIGVIEHMPEMLKEAGFQKVRQTTMTVYLRQGNPAYEMVASTLWQAAPLLQTFFVLAGVTTPDHFTQVNDEMLMELLEPGFTCNWSLSTVVGEK